MVMGTPSHSFPDACLILDEKNQVLAVNPAGEKLFRLEKDELVGKSLVEVCSGRSVSLTLEGSYSGDSKSAITQRLDELFGYAEIRISSLHSSDGEQVGRVMILRGIVDLSQQALRNQSEMLLALQESTFDLHSSLDLKVVLHNIVTHACKLLDTSHGYLATLSETGEMEPVVGLGALAAKLDTRVETGVGVTGIVWKTGRPLFIPDYDQWLGRLASFPHGRVRAVLGMPLFLDGQVLGVINIARGLESEVSFSEEDIEVLRRFADLAVLALQNARLFHQAQTEIAFRRKTEMELRNANQLLQFQLERIELLQGQLREMAVRDTLTNLFNRRYLQEMLGVEFARARRAKCSLAILMLDCDQLKYINDFYGHKVGDDALVHIANVIRDSTRAGDIACRYGGDEFVVVLNNVTPEIAYQRAENLRSRIAAVPISSQADQVFVHVSVGIAIFPVHGAQAEPLLQCADQALYAAKHHGKNQVLVYNDHP